MLDLAYRVRKRPRPSSQSTMRKMDTSSPVASQPDTSASKLPPFLKLPVEIRDMIYSSTPLHPRAWQTSPNEPYRIDFFKPAEFKDLPAKTPLKVLDVSHQISAEATRHFYAQYRFDIWCFKLDLAVLTIQKSFDAETRDLIKHVGFRTILSQKYHPDLGSRKENIGAILEMLPNVRTVDIKFLVAHESKSQLSTEDLVTGAVLLIGDLECHPGLTVSMFDEQGRWVEVLKGVRRVLRKAKALNYPMSFANILEEDEEEDFEVED